MTLEKLGTFARSAIVGIGVLAGVAGAQTPDKPIRSQAQLVVGSGTSQPFLVDAGASRVSIDLRQNMTTDTATVAGPSGLAVQATKAVEYPVVDQDMEGTGDALGHVENVMVWTAPDPGQHTISSPQEFVATVNIDGGVELSFWLDGLRADGSVAENMPITVRAVLTDPNGRDMSGASLTGKVIRRVRANGQASGPTDAWAANLVFQPSSAPGNYYAMLPGGVPWAGVYHVEVNAVRGFTRRDAATSIHAWTGAPAPRAAGAPPPPLTAQVITVAEPVQAGVGQIFYGTENVADPLKPVIVFLHGWNSHTAIWDRPNGGFWHAGLSANYRVASVGLHPDRDMMTNGAIVNQALAAIASYYDVKKVVVVAHSKGGVDLDASLMLMNGTDYVRTAMTLSTPHWGTALADFVDMLPDWLASSWKDEAQRSMMVANMAMFRALLANNPNQSKVDIRTFGAWGYDEVDIGSHETIEFIYRDITGPLLKSLAGDNDGIVPYASSVRPLALTIFGGKPDSRTEVNHAQIRKRVNYWAHIQAQLLTSSWDNTPSPPFNVVAQLNQATPETGSATLTWQNRARFANNLFVERSTDGGPYVDISGPQPATYTIYVDFNLAAGHTYAYRLRHNISGVWWSGYSNVASVVFPSPVPAAPSNLTATPLSASSIRLRWTDNSTNESIFEIWRRVAGVGSFQHAITTPANWTSVNDTGLAPNKTYEYKIRAVSGAYASAFSNVASATTPAAPLLAPSNLAGTYNKTTNRVTLTWTDNTVDETGFYLQMSYGGTIWSDLYPPTVGPNVRTYTTGPFPPQYGYYSFRVLALRNGEWSPWSNVAVVGVFP